MMKIGNEEFSHKAVWRVKALRAGMKTCCLSSAAFKLTVELLSNKLLLGVALLCLVPPRTK